jgi:hypothetical protein
VSGRGGNFRESLYKRERTRAKADPTLFAFQEFSAEWTMEHVTFNSEQICRVGLPRFTKSSMALNDMDVVKGKNVSEW